MDIPVATHTAQKKTTGLSMLLGAAVQSTGRLLDLPLDSIVRNEAQPRTTFDQDAIAALASSIESQGVIQPIAVRQLGGDRYEIIAGERRWLASRRAGLRTIPAVVHDTDDRESLVLAVVENVVREDLNAMEAARAYQMLIDEHGVTTAHLAGALGKSRPAVANTLRLLELPDDVIDAIAAGKLSEGHGRALLGLPDRSLQRRYARLVVDRALSVRATEAAVRDIVANNGTQTPHRRQWNAAPDAELQTAFDAFTEAVGSRARTKMKVGQRGAKLELHCADASALADMLEALAAGLRASS